MPDDEVVFECDECGDEFFDHPLSFAPHLCSRCEENLETDAIELGFVDEIETECMSQAEKKT